MVGVFTPAVVTAVCLLHTACGLHIDISRHGDVKIDLDLSLDAVEQRSPITTLDKPEDYQIDLSSGKVQGNFIDGEYLRFSNIPYATAPNDTDTRWFTPYPPPYDPDAPLLNDTRVRKCPQATPGWVPFSFAFLNDFGADGSLPAKWETPITPDKYGPAPTDPDKIEGDEDCLLLDVYVTNRTWTNRYARNFKPRVVVWIHGGGFTLGSKHDIGSPKGLFQAVNKTEEEDFLFVSINYRLGMFGWLGGERYRNEAGPSNLGILDQRKAIEWVQSNIGSFGGNPGSLAIWGQSAGAASILFHTTGEFGRPIWDKAILQSPGFFPQPDDSVPNATYTQVLADAKAKDIEELGKVDAKKLKLINAQTVHKSTYGQFTFGPLVDNIFVKKYPSLEFADNNHYAKVLTLHGYTGLDGLLFTPPWVRNADGLKKYVKDLYPAVKDDVLKKITDLYPLPGGGSAAAKIQILKVSDMLNDVAIKCNVYYHTKAILNKEDTPYDKSYRYAFNAAPAVHGADLSYAFYPETQTPPLSANDALAKKMQTKLIDFIRYYDPNPVDSEEWGVYRNDNRSVAFFGHQLPADYKFQVQTDPMTDADRARCDFWAPLPQASGLQAHNSFVLQNEL